MVMVAGSAAATALKPLDILSPPSEKLLRDSSSKGIAAAIRDTIELYFCKCHSSFEETRGSPPPKVRNILLDGLVGG